MRRWFRALDNRLLLLIVVLAALGLLTLYSAGKGTGLSRLWIKQGVWTIVGILMMTMLANIDPKRLFRVSLLFYLLGIVTLVAVFAMPKVNNTHRWISLPGLSFQPSELMKWLTLLFVANRLGSRPMENLTGWDIAGAIGIVALPMLLVMKQPDLGMALSFLPILLLIPLTKGLRFQWVALIIALTVLGGMGAWRYVLKPYQKQRVMTFLDPGSDLQGKGYQINQSRIAIGAGGIMGRGFTSGSQTQLNYLPVKTQDFIFSVWAEEHGFLGVLLALGLFGAFIVSLLQGAAQAKSLPESYFCAGAAGIFALHLLINVGMVAGALPNKGIALPFFSYGGSSTLSFFFALGVIMGVKHRAKVKG